MAWSLIPSNKTYVRKFNAHLHTYKLSYDKTRIVGGDLELETERLQKTLLDGLNISKKQADYVKGDKIRIIAQNPSFNNSISTETSTNVNFDNLLDQIENIVTSDQKVDINQTIFDIQIFKVPRGLGKNKILNLATDRRTKRSITVIKNTDNLCVPRAIVTALSYHTDNILGFKFTSNDIKQIRIGRKIQKKVAVKLCNLLGGDYEHGFTLEDIKNAEILLNVQIKIICADNFNTVIYEGCDSPTKLYLYKNKNHFDVINSMAAFYGSGYYCKKCDTKYNNKNRHRCKKTVICSLCKHPKHDLATKNKIYCNKCNRYCYNEDCLNNHSLTCAETVKCPGCNKIYTRGNFHQCGVSLCRNCMSYVETANHNCFMVRRQAKGGICNVACTCNKRGNDLNKGCLYKKYIKKKRQCLCSTLYM